MGNPIMELQILVFFYKLLIIQRVHQGGIK
jgi:hypothetical protein